MARDIVGYFDKLKQNARGGRRLDGKNIGSPNRRRDRPKPSKSDPAPSSPGGLGGVLSDILGRGRSTARSTASKVRDRVPTRTAPSRSRTTSTESLPPEGVVTIEYSPDLDGDPDPGEVVWSWVPFEEDPEQGKDRPVVVIGRRGSSLVGVPLTSRRNEREAQISLGTGDWDSQGRPSYARIWRMLDLDPQATRREGAVLDRRRFDQVVEAVDRYYDVRRSDAATRSG